MVTRDIIQTGTTNLVDGFRFEEIMLQSTYTEEFKHLLKFRLIFYGESCL